MKIIAFHAFCLIVLFTQGVSAQEKLLPNQVVARNIEPGKTVLFSIALNDGDYFNVSIGYKGKINFFLLNPDGTIARRLVGTSGEGKVQFPFAAEGAGSYSFKLENPGDQSATYELGIDEVISLNARLKPQPWSDRYPSPRIEALRKQIIGGNSNTDTFWKEIAERGTPLVEPFGSDGKYQLVTFLWRAQYETRNVEVRGSFEGPASPSDLALHRIEKSDVWYLTIKIPSGARFTYQLSPNDPMTFIGPREVQRSATMQADPFNLHRSDCPPNVSKFRCQSVAELPGAVPQPWLIAKTGTPQGRVEKQTIKSTIQKLDRPFSVYTPPNYKVNGPAYPLLILFDGEDLSSDNTQ